MEENQLKEIKLVLGYNYYIVNSLLPEIVKYPYNSMYLNYMDIDNFYKTYHKIYTRDRNNQEQDLISVIYKNMPSCCHSDTFNLIEQDIKEFFKYIINSGSYAIISKVNHSGKIHFFRERLELDKYRQNTDIKDRIFEDYCTIELSDKLLERTRNEQHSC